MTFSQSRAELSCQTAKGASAAAAPALHPRTSGPSLPRARGRGTEPAALGSRRRSHARSSARGPRGCGWQSRRGRDKQRPRRRRGATSRSPNRVSADRQRQPPGCCGGRGAGRGARRRKGGRRRARGVPRLARVARAATPPPRASLSNPPHYLDSGLPVTAAANGSASLGRRSESELEGVSCVPRSRGNLQVGMEKGRGWELGTRFVFQLVEILLFLSLALSFRSASWPGRALPPHGREQLPLGARHCGGCSPGMRKKRHVLVAGPHLLWIRTTPLRGNQRALWS